MPVIRIRKMTAAIVMIVLGVGIVTFWQSPLYLDIPFRAGVEGTVLDTEITIPYRDYYQFYLILHCKPDDPADHSRLQILAGTGETNASGRRVNNGIPIPISLRITTIGRNNSIPKVVLDETISDLPLDSFNELLFSKLILGINLDANVYAVRLEALRDIDELSNTSISFSIHLPVRK